MSVEAGSGIGMGAGAVSAPAVGSIAEVGGGASIGIAQGFGPGIGEMSAGIGVGSPIDGLSHFSGGRAAHEANPFSNTIEPRVDLSVPAFLMDRTLPSAFRSQDFATLWSRKISNPTTENIIIPSTGEFQATSAMRDGEEATAPFVNSRQETVPGDFTELFSDIHSFLNPVSLPEISTDMGKVESEIANIDQAEVSQVAVDLVENAISDIHASATRTAPAAFDNPLLAEPVEIHQPISEIKQKRVSIDQRMESGSSIEQAGEKSGPNAFVNTIKQREEVADVKEIAVINKLLDEMPDLDTTLTKAIRENVTRTFEEKREKIAAPFEEAAPEGLIVTAQDMDTHVVTEQVLAGIAANVAIPMTSETPVAKMQAATEIAEEELRDEEKITSSASNIAVARRTELTPNVRTEVYNAKEQMREEEPEADSGEKKQKDQIIDEKINAKRVEKISIAFKAAADDDFIGHDADQVISGAAAAAILVDQNIENDSEVKSDIVPDEEIDGSIVYTINDLSSVEVTSEEIKSGVVKGIAEQIVAENTAVSVGYDPKASDAQVQKVLDGNVKKSVTVFAAKQRI